MTGRFMGAFALCTLGKILINTLVAFYLGEAGRVLDAAAVQRGDHRPAYQAAYVFALRRLAQPQIDIRPT